MSHTHIYSAGTGAVIFSKSATEVLLIEEHKAPGRWGIAGGKLEAMPTSENLKREVLEETGFTIRIDSLVRIYHRYDCKPQRISFIYRATAIECAQPFESQEVRRIAWFAISDIPWNNLRFDDNRLMIRDALDNVGYPIDAVADLSDTRTPPAK